MSKPTYRAALQAVQGGKIDPVYLLAGGDTFLEDHFISQLVLRYLPADGRKQIYSLEDDKPEEVLAELGAYGLFQSKQLLVVRQVQRVSGKVRDELLAYVVAPADDKCLLLVLEDYQPAKGLHKRLAPGVVVVDTRPPFPDQIRTWAADYARDNGHQLDPEALDILMEYVGDSVGHVVSELDKLFIAVDDGAAVDPATVEAQVGADRRRQLWHLQQALARRDSPLSLAILVSLLRHGSRPSPIISAIAALFSQLLYLHSHTTAQKVYTGLNKLVSSEMGPMVRRYTPVDTARVLRALLAADVTLKSVSVDAQAVLIVLVTAICRGKA